MKVVLSTTSLYCGAGLCIYGAASQKPVDELALDKLRSLLQKGADASQAMEFAITALSNNKADDS
jgi:hypothetical protein